MQTFLSFATALLFCCGRCVPDFLDANVILKRCLAHQKSVVLISNGKATFLFLHSSMKVIRPT